MKYRLEDICLKVTDGAHFSPKDDCNSTIPMLSVKDMKEFDFDYENCKHIGVEDFKKMLKQDCVPQKNDVLVAKDGSYLKEIFVNNEEKEKAILSSIAIFRPNTKIVDPYFLCYLLKNPVVMKYTKDNCVSGSALPRIILKAFKDIKLEIPEMQVQKKIINVIKKINEKIILNCKINDNLFEISCLNYKEWYEKLKSNSETTYSKLKELGNIVMGQSPKGESYNFEKVGVPLINGAADYENGYLMAQKYTSMPTKICKKDDLIFCIRATIGLLVISDNEYCLGRGVAGITNINKEYKEYAFHIIYNSIEEFKKLATGSVIIGISRNDIEDIKVKIPTIEQIQEFHKIQSPIFEKMENIRKENQILIKLRDTLLPKLMNGEIDLDKIEI